MRKKAGIPDICTPSGRVKSGGMIPEKHFGKMPTDPTLNRFRVMPWPIPPGTFAIECFRNGAWIPGLGGLTKQDVEKQMRPIEARGFPIDYNAHFVKSAPKQ